MRRDLMQMTRLTFRRPKLFIFHSYSQLAIWLCIVAFATLFFAAFIESSALYFVLPGAIVGSLGSIIQIIPTEFSIKSPPDKTPLIVQALEAQNYVRSDKGHSIAHQTWTPLRHWLFKWKEDFVEINKVGDKITVRGPWVTMRKVVAHLR